MKRSLFLIIGLVSITLASCTINQEKLMENKKNVIATLHNRGTFTVKPEKFDEFKAMVIDSQKLIEAKKLENGPMNWDASFDKENNVIYIDGLFENEEAVLFHQNNITEIVKNSMPLLAAPPVSVTSEVFSFINN